MIPPNWRSCTLGDLAQETGGCIQTGPFGSQLHASDYLPEGVPVVMPVNIGDNRLVARDVARIGEDDAGRLSRHTLRVGDIVYSRRGDVEKRALVRPAQAGWRCGTGCLLVRVGGAHVDPTYVSYWLGLPETRAWVSQHAVGATMPNLNTEILSAVPVLLPPLSEQRGIARTLLALDDKIDSNERVGELCLALAVEAYQAASLKASQRLALGDAGKWLSGGTPSTEESAFWGGDFPWISAASLKSFHIAVSDRRLTNAGLQQATNVVPAGTVLLVVRGMSLKSELRMGVAQRPVAFGQDCKAIIPTVVPSALLATALYSARRYILELVDEAGHGTGRLQWDLLAAFPIAIPDDERLVPILDALLARGAAAAAESRKLAELRDALLPELLSGRLRVPEAATI